MFGKQKAFLSDFTSVIDMQMQKALEEHHLVLKDFIVEKQLYDKGIDGKGQKLPPYTRAYIRYKISKRQPADRTTLKDSGDFYASVKIVAFTDYFEISSDVAYDKYIFSRYTKDVLRATNDNLRAFLNKFFIPKIKEYVDNKLAG